MKIAPLTASRWGELDRALRESGSDEQLPKPEQSIMLGAFYGDQMVGCIGAERAWLVSPFWVQRDHRGSGLASELATALAVYNHESLREVCATTSNHVERLIFSLGFKPIRGQIWRREIDNG